MVDVAQEINSHFSPAQAALYATIAGWICSAAVQALPSPDQESGKGYRFAYKFFHTLAANVRHVKEQNKEDKEARQ